MEETRRDQFGGRSERAQEARRSDHMDHEGFAGVLEATREQPRRERECAADKLQAIATVAVVIQLLQELDAGMSLAENRRFDRIWGGTVKLTRRGRTDPSMAWFHHLFSRHRSPHPRHRTLAFSVSGGDQLGAGGAPHERGSVRARAPTRSVGRVRQI